MLRKARLISLIGALLAGLISMPAKAEYVIYTFDYTQNFSGGTVSSGTLVGTGTLTLDLPSADVASYTNISSSQNTSDFVSFKNTFGTTPFNFTSIGTNSIGIIGSDNDALNSFSFNTSANGDSLSLGLTSFSISGPGLNEGNEVTLVSTTFTSAIPETSTWAMMILGFFGLGFMAYRKKAAPYFA
jgi:hypothetical protein